MNEAAMDLIDLLTTKILSLKKEEIGTLVGPDPERYSSLVDMAFSREMPICWRATWIMDYLAEEHPWLAEPHIGRIWNEIPAAHPDGVTRSALRLLARYDIPEEQQGVATDLCLDWLQKESVPVAIKVYSMELLLKIAKDYPELSNEFITIMEDQKSNNTVAFTARARHIIRALEKL